MYQFWEYKPDSWLDEDGLSFSGPIGESRPNSSPALRGNPSNWLMNLATASVVGVSLAVTSLLVHAETPASTLCITVHVDPSERDRLGELFSGLRGGSVRWAALDLMQRAELIANRTSPAPVDLDEWAARLAQDVANARD